MHTTNVFKLLSVFRRLTPTCNMLGALALGVMSTFSYLTKTKNL